MAPTTASFPNSGNIVSRWQLDEASGDAVDSVGADTLTDTNTVGAGGGLNGLFNNSRDFEKANSEYFFKGNPAPLNITGSLSLSAWIYMESLPGVHMNIIGKWESDANRRQYLLSIDPDGKLTLDVSSDGTAANQKSVTGSTVLSTGVWYHVVGVYEASVRLEVYVRGISDGTNTTSIPATIYSGSSSFFIGISSIGAGATTYFDGLIQDSLIWSNAQSDAEALAIYNLYPSGILGSPIFFT